MTFGIRSRSRGSLWPEIAIPVTGVLICVGASYLRIVPWIIWAVLLVAQNASFTWASRARNSPDVRAHALAAVFSNGVFFANLYCAVDQIHTATGFWQRAGVIAFYTFWTVAGSVAAHWYMLKQKR